MRLRGSAVAVFGGMIALCACLAAWSLVSGTAAGMRATPTEARAEQQAAHDASAYTLPPAKLAKAKELTRLRMELVLGGTTWALVQLVLVLALGIAARVRDLALRTARNYFAQAAIFVLLLLGLTWLCSLPLSVYGHREALAYGLSVQGWGSWCVDKAKGFALDWLVASGLAMVLMGLVRRSPERWWLWFWLPSVAVVLAGLFVVPYVVDPMFNRFTPMAQANPALVPLLERVVARSGMSIPPERMFVMEASAKYTGINAYVTGFGASKRIVVWDTTIAKSTPDEIAVTFGHELGHYALGHVIAGTLLACASLGPCFWLGFLAVRWLLARYGRAWRIAGQTDWAALAAMLLVAQVLMVLAEPVANAVSRSFEHAADVYGQEAVHGIVGDPRAVARSGFQEMGELSLDDPTPHPWMEWWFDTHPPTRERAAFAAAYDPWKAGAKPKFFKDGFKD